MRPSDMSSYKRFDWSGFFVHFVLGALVGAVLGFGFWVRSPEAASTSMTPGMFYIGGGALVGGLSAGLMGDRFWESLGDWFSWWWWWWW